MNIRIDSSWGFLKQASSGVNPGKKRPATQSDEEKKAKQKIYEDNRKTYWEEELRELLKDHVTLSVMHLSFCVYLKRVQYLEK